MTSSQRCQLNKVASSSRFAKKSRLKNVTKVIFCFPGSGFLGDIKYFCTRCKKHLKEKIEIELVSECLCVCVSVCALV